jgi:hypothetical protein
MTHLVGEYPHIVRKPFSSYNTYYYDDDESRGAYIDYENNTSDHENRDEEFTNVQLRALYPHIILDGRTLSHGNMLFSEPNVSKLQISQVFEILCVNSLDIGKTIKIEQELNRKDKKKVKKELQKEKSIMKLQTYRNNRKIYSTNHYLGKNKHCKKFR